jgi:hypothetical protein
MTAEIPTWDSGPTRVIDIRKRLLSVALVEPRR